MTTLPDPDITLDVNLANPGQFFACCGLLELAARNWPGTAGNGWRQPEGWFAGETGRATFHIATKSGLNDPLAALVDPLLAEPSPFAFAPDHAGHAADRQPVILGGPFGLRLDWWLESYRGGDKSELKVWAGQQTPMRNFQSAREACRALAVGENRVGRGVLDAKWPMSGRFGFDPSSTPTSLDVGFSTDEQGIPVLTSPATEMLAAIGLQRFRPRRDENRRGRWFVYRAWHEPLAASLAAAAMTRAGGASPTWTFRVAMRNAQYGNFDWAQRWEKRQ